VGDLVGGSVWCIPIVPLTVEPPQRTGPPHLHKETVMNPIRAIGRLACILAGLAATFAAAASEALAATPPGQARPLSWPDPPLPPGWNKHPPLPPNWASRPHLPPGWNKHPPVPAHTHLAGTGGLPGWQITLIAVAAVLLAAATVVRLARARAARRRAAASPA
jgi:hypothetical protein